jgi:aspartate aminotransferase
MRSTKDGLTTARPPVCPDLRQTIADYVSRTRNVPVTSDEVVVVPGGKPIIFFTILALIDAGDEVIYPNPGFPIYESMIRYSAGKAVPSRSAKNEIFLSM